jgi:hypothetical protein
MATYVPYYGPPGPGTGWETTTEITSPALDNIEQGTIDNSVAVDEIAPGAPGFRQVDPTKLPVGTTAGTVAAGDDSRFVSIPTVLNNALLCVIEVAGVYGARPVWPNPVVWMGTDTPTGGGTVTSGTTAVDGFDVYIPMP